MTIRDIIRDDPVWASPYISVAEVAEIMARHGCAFVPILEHGLAVGVITDRDLALASAMKGVDPHSTLVKEVMSNSPRVVSADAHPEDAARLMIEHNVRRLVVHHEGRFVGVVSMIDLAGRIADETLVKSLTSMAASNHPKQISRDTQPIPGLYLG